MVTNNALNRASYRLLIEKLNHFFSSAADEGCDFLVDAASHRQGTKLLLQARKFFVAWQVDLEEDVGSVVRQAWAQFSENDPDDRPQDWEYNGGYYYSLEQRVQMWKVAKRSLLEYIDEAQEFLDLSFCARTARIVARRLGKKGGVRLYFDGYHGEDREWINEGRPPEESPDSVPHGFIEFLRIARNLLQEE